MARLERGTRFGTDCRTLLSFVPNGSCCGTCHLKNNTATPSKCFRNQFSFTVCLKTMNRSSNHEWPKIRKRIKKQRKRNKETKIKSELNKETKNQDRGVEAKKENRAAMDGSTGTEHVSESAPGAGCRGELAAGGA